MIWMQQANKTAAATVEIQQQLLQLNRTNKRLVYNSMYAIALNAVRQLDCQLSMHSVYMQCHLDAGNFFFLLRFYKSICFLCNLYFLNLILSVAMLY